MTKKIISVGCALLIMLSLCGCQLAREDPLSPENDRLIGAFITPEYLNLFDMDSYLNDNITSIINGGEVSQENSEKYSGRLYAELQPSGTSPDGSKFMEYVFPDLEGIILIAPKITDSNGDVYHTTSSDDAICDAHFSVGDNTSIEGTIYMAPAEIGASYINPVYQSDDGSVYLTTGSCLLFSNETDYAAQWTQSLDETLTVTENGGTRTQSFKVTITLEAKNPDTSIAVFQMGADNMPISSQEYTPESLPESITLGKDVSYLLVETHTKTPDGESITREIVEPDKGSIKGYRLRDDNIYYVAVFTELIWE